MFRTAIALLGLFLLTSCATQPKHRDYTVAPHYFEENPAGKPLGPCHGGAVIDKAGNIYITTDTDRGIIVFSPDGKFLRAFGPSFIHGLELRNEKGVEYIYGARPNFHEVVKIKLDGEKVWTLTYPKDCPFYQNADAFKPCAVTVGPDGSIYVADGYGQNYVLKFDQDLKFVKAFGGKAKEGEVGKIGTFNTCHGIALDTRGKTPLLFVCNRNNDRVEYWDLDGNFVKVIQQDLRMPAAVMIRGDYAILPELKGRATLLDQEGNIVARVGDNPNEKQRANYALPPDQWTVGICNSPHGAAIDKHGDLIITEWSKFGRVQKFTVQK